MSNGRRVLLIVIAATRKPPEKETPQLPQNLILAVSARDFFPRRVTLLRHGPDHAGKRITVTLTDVKLNAGLPPETFHYEIPPGAEYREIGKEKER